MIAIALIALSAQKSLGLLRDSFGQPSVDPGSAYEVTSQIHGARTTLLFPAGESSRRYQLTLNFTDDPSVGWLAYVTKKGSEIHCEWVINLYDNMQARNVRFGGTLAKILSEMGVGVGLEVPLIAEKALSAKKAFASYRMVFPSESMEVQFISDRGKISKLYFSVSSVAKGSERSVSWPQTGLPYKITPEEKRWLQHRK